MRTFIAVVLLCFVADAAQAAGWRAGVARANITPEKLMWMSGYGARTGPAEGKLSELWARALVIDDGQGHRALLYSLDLVGIDRETSLRICRQLQDKLGLSRDQVAINCSHTHSGPVVGNNLRAMFFFDDAQQKLVDEYTAQLEKTLVALADEAIKKLAPAELSYGEGTCDVAVNRRNNKEADAAELRASNKFVGPVDHRVPVLVARDAGGKLLAVVFGYACHATVLSGMQWSADYPGYAVETVEQKHPEAVAMYWAGCGADSNALPRRTVDKAHEYGDRVGDAVNLVLDGKLTPLPAALVTRYGEIPLPFDTLPTREELEAQAASTDKFVAQRGQILLRRLNSEGSLASTYPYPVQVWRLGPELRWVILGGEVVVDYSLRLGKELGPGPVWVAGYSNDVMSYIPSKRVWQEDRTPPRAPARGEGTPMWQVLTRGGYEGARSMTYYGLPTTWAAEAEEMIVAKVHELAR
ncbi:MAG: neutral/alkaline non-lysosomal ceramidase N-terminal domain-containing protein [Planctomycetes bacterium]|nr:neutral/alkaline non-lysosomal ceramidase N-terminal domain-containing protein [Planctomycetota bacterium]